MLKRLMLATLLVAAPVFALAQDDKPVSTTAGLPATTTTPNAPAAAPLPPVAGPQNTIQLVYTVFLGGINLGTVGLKSSFEGSNYAAVSRLKTAGVVNSFYESVIDASVVGTVDGNALRPQKYDSDYTGEKSSQKVSLAYMGGGGIQLFSDPPYNVNRFPVSDEQKLNTLDPLSGIIYNVAGISNTADKPCGDTVRVFDGRRRYDVELSYVGKENISSSDNYSGPAIKCEMRYRQIAGFKQTLTKTTLPTITVWFATFETKEPGPMKSFHVAVKLLAETPYGVAIAHARKITIDGSEKSG